MVKGEKKDGADKKSCMEGFFLKMWASQTA